MTMTQTEYEQKRRECWEEFKRENLDGEVQWQPVSRYDVFCDAFDRAYALGKQTETISQEEIENEAVDYAFGENKKRSDARPDTAPEYMCEDLIDAFKAGANFALGKQEKDAGTVIQGWVARDCDGDVFLYQNEPDRNEIAWNGYMMHSLPIDSFPDLTWESDPQPVEIILKRKKK